MRVLLVLAAALLASSAQAAPSRLETIFQETNRLVIEINAFDRSLQLHLTSFGRQGRSAAAHSKDARALRRSAAALLKRWDAPSKEWKTLPQERREQFKSMRRWLADLDKTVLDEKMKSRMAFEQGVAACSLGQITAGIGTLCRTNCSPETLLRGYGTPCSLRERKTVLLMPINREKLAGGKHHVEIEGGALALQPHGSDALRAPLARFWSAAFEFPLSKLTPDEVEAVRRYPENIKADSPERATGRAAVERILSIWNLQTHSDPATLEPEAADAAKRAYAEMTGEAASASVSSSETGIRSNPAARDAIRRVLRAAGSPRGVSSADAQRLLDANRPAEAPGDWPAYSLRTAVLTLIGAPAGDVAPDGTVVFSGTGTSIRVVADPANGSFRVCGGACGETDFLTIDGKSPVIPAAKPVGKPEPKKKKSWWFGGSSDDDDENKEEVPTLPTRFLIQELR